MKTFVPLLALCVLGPTTVHAEPPSRPDLLARQDAAAHKRYSGKILTIMGAVHLALGSALLITDGVQSRQCAHEPGCFNEGGSIAFDTMGALLVSSGAVFASAGVPMWIVGARDVRRSEVALSVSAGGMRLTF